MLRALLGKAVAASAAFGAQQLPSDVVLVDARVQSRLSTIDARAKLVPELATRNQRNNPSLHNA
jgi:hypothetical protein